MASTIVGIDIGSNSIRAVEVQGATKPNPVITRFHEEALPAGSVRRGEVMEVATVSAALKRLWSAGGFKSKDVVLGMGGPRVFARDILVPKASLAQIRESLPFHVQDHLPVPVSEALLDFYPISEETTEDGLMVNGLLVAAIKEAVLANVNAVSAAGLNPIHVDLIPFALTRALGDSRQASGLTVLVGIGANTTNLIITQNGVPQFVRIIASGGDDVTRALGAAHNLDHARAEQYKRHLGMGVQGGMREEDRPALSIIYGVVGELLNSIRNTISFYSTSKRGVVPERIVLSGGGTQLIGLPQALAELTGLPVVPAEPLAGAELSRNLRAASTPQQQDSMATAFGLALGTSA